MKISNDSDKTRFAMITLNGHALTPIAIQPHESVTLAIVASGAISISDWATTLEWRAESLPVVVNEES